MYKLHSTGAGLVFVLSLFVMTAYAQDNEDDKYTIIEAALVEALRRDSGSYIYSKTELNNEELTERIISYSRGLIAKV